MKIYYHDFPFIDIKECSCKRGFFSFFSRKDKPEHEKSFEMRTIGGSIRQKRRRSKRKRTSKFLEIPLLYNKKKTLKREITQKRKKSEECHFLYKKTNIPGN